MTASPHVAVVATSLARSDRRALSQAWYSALHLADHQAPARPASANAAMPPASHGRHTSVSRGGGVANAPGAPVRRGGDARALPALPAPDRRSPATPLAKRIERALVRAERRAQPATVAIKAADGRIHLVVRADRDATRIVALCAPALRASVERALAHARFALAGSGVHVEVGA